MICFIAIAFESDGRIVAPKTHQCATETKRFDGRNVRSRRAVAAKLRDIKGAGLGRCNA
jgi:hypothetical protein